MILLQALVNGLVSGTLLAVPAIGFTAMFAVLRFPNFSVSGVATLGAFAGYLAYGAGLQMAGSLVVAFAVAGAVGLLFDKLAHRFSRKTVQSHTGDEPQPAGQP